MWSPLEKLKERPTERKWVEHCPMFINLFFIFVTASYRRRNLFPNSKALTFEKGLRRRAEKRRERETVQITEINIPNQLIKGGWKKRNSINSKNISFWGQVGNIKKKMRRNWKCSLSMGEMKKINPIKKHRFSDVDEWSERFGVRKCLACCWSLTHRMGN